MVDLIKKDKINIDLLIYDEVHNTVGLQIQNMIYHNNEYDGLIKNNNGIIMLNHTKEIDTGVLAYEYIHTDGVCDAILNAFDKCSDQNVFIVSSCKTIGEGIDTMGKSFFCTTKT